MRKIHYLSLSALLASAPAWSLQFASSMNVVKLPHLISTEQPPAIKYTPPGSIAVSALRMCGDGDVANFHEAHPEFDFVPHEVHDLDVLVGYWVVEDGASDILPSNSNWYPIAYKKLPIAENASSLSSSGKFLPISHAPVAANANVMDLIKSDLVNLHDIALQSFQTNKSYRIFSGAFACVDPDESSELSAEGSGSYSPSPIETVQSLKEIDKVVEDAFKTLNISNILDSNKKLKIDLKSTGRNLGTTSAPKPYDFDLGHSGKDLDGALYDSYKNILNAPYPAAAATNDDYKAAMTSLPWHTALSSGLAGDKIAYCNAQGAASNKDSKTYNFEAFPLNLSCKKLFNDLDLSNAYTALFNPSSKPSETDYKTAQKNLAKRFLLAAAYETAQRSLNVEAKVARSGCFKKSGQNLIGRLVASYPLNFAQESARYSIKANAHNHLHPESLFALSDYNNYSQHDALAIWGQVTPSQGTFDVSALKSNAIRLPLGDKTELNTHKVDGSSFSAPININFKVRSVGGSCTIFC